MTKKTKSLNEEQLYDMMWSNDWEIVEKTQKLLELCKGLIQFQQHGDDKDRLQIQNYGQLVEIQDLIDKRYNIIGAQMILSEVKK
jgi:hypothetical protein